MLIIESKVNMSKIFTVQLDLSCTVQKPHNQISAHPLFSLNVAIKTGGRFDG